MPSIPTTELLSGITGSVSLAAWVFVLVPQLVENHRLKSAKGVSLSFLVIWFIGDITNLLGSIWARLVPTVIALAIYFCFADVILILQCLYYNRAHSLAAPPPREDGAYDQSREPLLGRRPSTVSSNSACQTSPEQRLAVHTKPSASLSIQYGDSIRPFVVNSFTLLMICAIGTLGWVLAWLAGLWRPIDQNKDSFSGNPPLAAVSLGYVSAICYLGARLPQILKNFREKSCEGLSLLFFLLSILGNLTYGGSILFHSTDRGYLLTNTPWLIGSLGTMAEDVVIFFQFHIYARAMDTRTVPDDSRDISP